MITIKLDLRNEQLYKRIVQLENKGFHKIAIEDNKVIILRKYD